MVDPSKCPMPPGFMVIRGQSINDDFEYWSWLGVDQHTTEYSSTGRSGWSHRWNNSKVRSAYVVTGFQFRIGPDLGKQWEIVGEFPNEQIIYYDITHADVDLKFPRIASSSMTRGCYILTIKTYADGSEPEPYFRKSEGIAGKEFPHPKTTGFNFTHNPEPINDYGWEPDPRPDIGQVRDGNWHGFVAAVWNHEQEFPRMALWYNPNATGNWRDFIFLGFSQDKPGRVMPPGPPLTRDIVNDHDQFEDIFDGDFFQVKHVIQIRIDGVTTDQVAVRNMYAANVSVYEDPVNMPPPPLYLVHFLHYRDFSFPVSIRSVGEGFGLTAPISVREITERLQKNIL